VLDWFYEIPNLVALELKPVSGKPVAAKSDMPPPPFVVIVSARAGGHQRKRSKSLSRTPSAQHRVGDEGEPPPAHVRPRGTGRETQ
jgi:hypothetical protein